VAAWLLTAVATGYGVAAADAGAATGSPSSSTSDGASKTSSGETSTGTAPSTTGTTSSATQSKDNGSSLSGTGPRATRRGAEAKGATKTSGATSFTDEVAPGVTLSSSGGGHRSQLPDLAHILKHATEAFAPSAPAGTQIPTGTTRGVDAQAKSTGAITANTTSEAPDVSSSPMVSAVQAATQQAASALAKVESKLHSNVANAAAASVLTAGLWRFESTGGVTLVAAAATPTALAKWPVGTRLSIEANTWARHLSVRS
jgi:hypothetical protein